MNLWKRYQQLSCNIKKYIAVGLSVGIAAAGLAVPVPEMRSSAMKIEIPEPEPEPEPTSVSMDVSSSMAEQEPQPEPEKGDPVAERGIIGMDENGNVVKESRVVGGDKPHETGRNTGVIFATTEAPKMRLEGALEAANQGREDALDDLYSDDNELARYADETADPNLKLYGFTADDHGGIPDLAVLDAIWQFPVELGYPADENYNGKLTEMLPDILEMSFDDLADRTEEQAGGKDNSNLEDGQKGAPADEDLTESSGGNASVSSGTGMVEGSIGSEEGREGIDQAAGRTEDKTDAAVSQEKVQSGTGAADREAKQSGNEETVPERTDSTEDADGSRKDGAAEKSVQPGRRDGAAEEATGSGRRDGAAEEAAQSGRRDGVAEEATQSERRDGTEGESGQKDETAEESAGSDQEDRTTEESVGSTREDGVTGESSQTGGEDSAAEESAQTGREAGTTEESPQIEGEAATSEGLQEGVESNKTELADETGTTENQGGLGLREVLQHVADQAEKLQLFAFLNNIYDKVIPAEPAWKEQRFPVERPVEDMEVSSGAEGTDEPEAQAVCEIVARGLKRGIREVYAGEIELIPDGQNGFNQIRLESDEAYADSVVLKEDAASEDVKVCVTNGTEEFSAVLSISKDTRAPEMKVQERVHQILHTEKGDIYCGNSPDIRFQVEDGQKGSGVERATLIYGDRFGFLFDGLEDPCYTLPEHFYGLVNYSCEDRAGNISEALAQYFLIEKDAPEIQIAESERYTAPYIMGISVEDTGEIVSGIASIECMVNGEPYELNNITTTETVRLAEDLEVPAKQAFSLDFKETGHYDISLQVSDNCGNAVMLHKEIDVTEEELVAVYLAKEFKINVDPYQMFGREQVFSEGLALKNISNVDTKITLKEVNVQVKSETLDNGVYKDCKLYLIAPDTGERIPLQNGLNEDVYSYLMPAAEAGTLSNIDFVGELSEGSEEYWQQEDISINLNFVFEKTN